MGVLSPPKMQSALPCTCWVRESLAESDAGRETAPLLLPPPPLLPSGLGPSPSPLSLEEERPGALRGSLQSTMNIQPPSTGASEAEGV